MGVTTWPNKPNTVRGFDASYWCREIDWDAFVDTEEPVFGYLRATFGISTFDTRFESYREGCIRKGVLWGFYQYTRPAQGSPKEHIEALKHMMPNGDYGQLPPWADMEQYKHDPVIKGTPLINWTYEYLQMLDDLTGMESILYGNYYYIRDYLCYENGTYPDWLSERKLALAQYPEVVAEPRTPPPFSDWNMWQFTDDGIVAGINTTVDLDFFNGTVEELKELAGGQMVTIEISEACAKELREALEVTCPEQPPQPPQPPQPGVPEFKLDSPLENPLESYWITQEFNENYANYSGLGGHDGIDAGIVVGTPIYASHDGIITVAGKRRDNDPYGCHVRISAQGLDYAGIERTFISIYGHLNVVEVAEGQTVSAGDLLGYSGGHVSDPCAGNSSGPHLHYGLICEGAYDRKETYLRYDFVNPWIYLGKLSTEPIARRRVKQFTHLNVRNLPTVDGSVVRYTMSPGTTFNVYESTGGDWPWGAQDVSRTAWNSTHYNWSEPIA